MEGTGPTSVPVQGRTPIGRGWRLTASSWRMTWGSRTVLMLAAIAAASGVVALAAAFFTASGGLGGGHPRHVHIVAAALLALYPFTFLTSFFDVGVAAAAGAGFDGDRVSIRDALRVAHSRADRIALWAAITAAIAVLLGLSAASMPGLSGLAAAALDLLWVLATIFVIPLLALQDADPRQVVRDSRSLLARSWGEDLTGIAVIGLWAFLMALPALFLLLIGLAMVALSPSDGGLVVIAVAAAGLIAARAVAGALQQVFAVALYRYAAGGPT